jgi:hypothetical protein
VNCDEGLQIVGELFLLQRLREGTRGDIGKQFPDLFLPIYFPFVHNHDLVSFPSRAALDNGASMRIGASKR